jgi:hypothetical protein
LWKTRCIEKEREVARLEQKLGVQKYLYESNMVQMERFLHEAKNFNWNQESFKNFVEINAHRKLDAGFRHRNYEQ